MKKTLLCIIVAFLNACTSGPIGNPNVPQPTEKVELDRYIGKWYEIARYENSFEKGCDAVTADYTLRKDGLIHVLNTCRKGGIDGPMDTAIGTAKIVESSGNAKLKVSFLGPFYFADYWILDHAEDYSWSIVGEPSGRYVWLLARTPTLSRQQQDLLINKLKTLGYNTSLLVFPIQKP